MSQYQLTQNTASGSGGEYPVLYETQQGLGQNSGQGLLNINLASGGTVSLDNHAVGKVVAIAGALSSTTATARIFLPLMANFPDGKRMVLTLAPGVGAGTGAGTVGLHTITLAPHTLDVFSSTTTSFFAGRVLNISADGLTTSAVTATTASHLATVVLPNASKYLSLEISRRNNTWWVEGTVFGPTFAFA